MSKAYDIPQSQEPMPCLEFEKQQNEKVFFCTLIFIYAQLKLDLSECALQFCGFNHGRIIFYGYGLQDYSA